MKTTKYGKYYETARLALESTAGLILNEGLEVSKDGEKGGWSDGYLDFAEDVALTVGGNYLGVLAAGFFLGTSAPVLATAAVGVGTATLVGGLYSWGKDKILDYYNQPEEKATTQQRHGASAPLDNAQAGDLHTQQDPSSSAGVNSENENDYAERIFNDFMQTNQTEQKGSNKWVTHIDDCTAERDDGSEYNIVIQREYDEEGNPTGNYRNVSNEYGTWEVTDEWVDNDHDGTPSETPDGNQDDPDDSDPTVSQENPMNESGDSSNYSGNHNDLKDFKGEIDYGPAGKSGEEYNGDHDILTGLNPRIDYGQDGKRGENYAGERDDLIGFDGSLDWSQDHPGKREFTGSPLTEILGGMKPRAGLTELSTNDVVAMISFNDPLLA